MQYLERKKYIDRIGQYRKTSRVILVSGLSGSGKSTLLAAIAHALRSEKPPVRIVQTGMTGEPLTAQQLLSDAKALGSGKSALFIDNADAVPEIANLATEISGKYDTTIFITGKNTSRLEALLVSQKTLICAVLRCSPFSYREFLEFHGLADSRKTLGLYAAAGGLPETGMISPASPDRGAFLALAANSFVLKSIIEPFPVRNPGHVRKLLELAARSTGESLSARQISASFAADRQTISPQAALDYLALCRDSGILVPVAVRDVKLGKNIESGYAWYFADNGLRTPFVTRAGVAENDRAVENLVCLHLLDEGWAVSQGRVDCGRRTKEKISFVCERSGKKIYVQVCGNSATAGERLRKRNALLAVRDAWPKYFVDADSGATQEDGIRHVYARDFLLGEVPIGSKTQAERD